MEKRHMHLSPAQCTVRAFKGVRAVARALGRDPGNVSRWARQWSFPTQFQKTLLEKAQAASLDLTAEDLILGRAVPIEEEEKGA